MNVLVILAHPRRDSFCGALHDAVCAGVQEAGLPLEELIIADLDFDPDLRAPSPELQRLEPDLQDAQRLIRWADHLVFVHPTWWGTVPACLKAFLERTLIPGFAFAHHSGGNWEKLLAGRTAQQITTMDTPALVHRWLYGNPVATALCRATLGYCGIRTVRRLVLTPLIGSSSAQRTVWLARAQREGQRLRGGALNRRQRYLGNLTGWLQALRLQFYPLAFIAYATGALTALTPGVPLQWHLFWLGYAALFVLEAATVFSNDLLDCESDRINRNAGPFSGGSRVLIDRNIDSPSLGRASLLMAGAFAVLAGSAALQTKQPIVILTVFAVLAVLALGYTLPPLKLSYRSMGELDVALTHSIGVLLPGWLLQGGNPTDPLPWMLSLPLALAILPAILLAGIPDFAADRQTGKRTLVVRLGIGPSFGIAIVSTLTTVGLTILMLLEGRLSSHYGDPMWGSVAHGVLLALWMERERRRCTGAARLDALIAFSLSYVLWFALMPLVANL